MHVDPDARLKKTAEVRTEVVKAPRRGRRVMVLIRVRSLLRCH